MFATIRWILSLPASLLSFFRLSFVFIRKIQIKQILTTFNHTTTENNNNNNNNYNAKYLSNFIYDPNGDSDQDTAKFDETGKLILRDMRHDPKFHGSVELIEKALDKCMKCCGGVRSRTGAYLTIEMFQDLNSGKQISEEDEFLNYVCGWLMQILHAVEYVPDNLNDDCYSQNCHGCKVSFGLNEIVLLWNFATYILLKYFHGKTYVLRILKRINDVNLSTILKNDLTPKNGCTTNTIDIDTFSLASYKQHLLSVQTKPSLYYTFVAPVVFAMEMSGITNQRLYDAVEAVTSQIIQLYQIQTDFLNCYGNSEITNGYCSIQSDIKSGKTTWLIAKALESSSTQQRSILVNNYGRNNEIAEANIKIIYTKLGLQAVFYNYEEQARNELYNQINALPSCIPIRPF